MWVLTYTDLDRHGYFSQIRRFVLSRIFCIIRENVYDASVRLHFRNVFFSFSFLPSPGEYCVRIPRHCPLQKQVVSSHDFLCLLECSWSLSNLHVHRSSHRVRLLFLFFYPGDVTEYCNINSIAPSEGGEYAVCLPHTQREEWWDRGLSNMLA